ncbi:MAG: cytochrome c3 family protein [Syntrophorhabdaceae bacterium]
MKRSITITAGLAIVIFLLAAMFHAAYAQKKPPDPLMLKLEGAKFPAVAFSHSVHTERAKVDCVICHHKDKNPKEPGGCMPCHDLKDVKKGAIPIKDAYHKNCIECHKDAAAKEVSAPTKCNDCHKKQ